MDTRLDFIFGRVGVTPSQGAVRRRPQYYTGMGCPLGDVGTRVDELENHSDIPAGTRTGTTGCLEFAGRYISPRTETIM